MKIFASSLVCDKIAKATGLETLELKPYSYLDAPVNTHADMLVFAIDKTIFCYKDYYYENKCAFDKAEKDGYKIICVSKKCSKDYPNDIGLNVLRMGRVLFANLSHTAKEILQFANENGYTLVNTKQGYAACSTLVLNDENAITADKGIYKAVISQGKNAVLISSDGIRLDGYNCGFIGGASFVINNTVYFYGDIENHPDFSKIHSKILELGMEKKSISSGYVYDFGGIRLI